MNRPFDPERSMALVIGAGARFEADSLMLQTIDDAEFVSGKLTTVCNIPSQRIISKYGPDASSEALLKELDRIAEQTLEDPLEIFFFISPVTEPLTKGSITSSATITTEKDSARGLSSLMFLWANCRLSTQSRW